jgi:hypothetical protein
MTREELEQVRVLVLMAFCHVPSEQQCKSGDSLRLAQACKTVAERLNEALDLLKEEVNKP